MKVTIKRPCGTIVEAEGTPEECAALVAALGAQPTPAPPFVPFQVYPYGWPHFEPGPVYIRPWGWDVTCGSQVSDNVVRYVSDPNAGSATTAIGPTGRYQ